MKSMMFSSPMIRALIAGRKTQTRRVLELPMHLADAGAIPLHRRTLVHPGATEAVAAAMEHRGEMTVYRSRIDEAWIDPGGTAVFGAGPYLHVPYERDGDLLVERVRCWYGYPPDQIWVKETWRPGPSGGPPIEYRADYDDAPKRRTKYGEMPWGSPRFMARSYSRLTLTLTRVRIEKLHDITEADATAEGCVPRPPTALEVAGHVTNNGQTASDAYSELWDSINGKRGLGWEMNPVVVVLEFTVQQHEAQSLVNAAV